MAEPANTLRQRLRDAAVEAMLDSAERVMAQKGYEKATMHEIAAAAGCATGTFYLYFKNKEELFQEIVARHADVAFDAAYKAMAGVDDPLEKVRQGMVCWARYASEHKPLFRLTFTALPMRHRAMRQHLSGTTLKHHEEYDRAELAELKRAQKLGRIRGDISAEALQEFTSAVWFSVVEQFVFAQTESPLEEQVDLLWGLVANGMGVKGNQK